MQRPVKSLALVMAIPLGLPIATHAQEIEGAIIVARDVPTRHAFLPGSGEPLVVNTAPFVDVWGGISPGTPMNDHEADAVVGRFDKRHQTAADLDRMGRFAPDAVAMDATSLNGGGSAQSGIGGIVGQALDSGLGSLKAGLDQVQSVLGGGG